MLARTRWIAGGLLAAGLSLAVLLVACAGPQRSRGAGAGAAVAHPKVDADLDGCASCHQQVSPPIAAEWRDGRHGMALVKCFVCHGSTGSDFTRVPGTSACRSCHPSEWASVAREGATQSCFGCHPPHALTARGKASPHVLAVKEVRP